VRHCRGLATDGRRLLLNDSVPREVIRKFHRVSAYVFLVTGKVPAAPPAPFLDLPTELRTRGAEFIASGGRRTVGVFPGSNASSRRWDPERFRAAVERMAEQGDHVVVFGGPSETALTAFVAGDAAIDAGGQTDLPLLAAALAACDILLSNDSGPLHVAAAVGTPTVSLQGASNPAVTGVVGTQHRFLRRADLACVPCVRNVCPRSGPGYLLPEAQRECLRLIEVPDVLAAVSPST
jgi:ADP-heptose:LPS heptosyltransferase